MTTADAYDAAADLIEKSGWCQDGFGYTPDEPHCIVGAIAQITGSRRHEPLQRMLENEDRLGHSWPSIYGPVVAWQHSLKKKNGKQITVRALRRAARQLREGKLA